MTTTQLTTANEDKSTVDREGRDFGALDKFGRRIGAIIRRSTVTFTAVPEGQNYGYRMAPGKYFAFRPSATRNEAEYGAGQPTQYFDTEAKREAAIAKYLAGAQKRASKI